MRNETVRLTLPDGLSADRAAGLARVIATATGVSAAAPDLPWLAPALLFADPTVQARLALPAARPGQALVHDYQAIRYDDGFPVGMPLDAELLPERHGAAHRFTITLCGPTGESCAALTTALRYVSAAEAAAAAPLALRDGVLREVERTTDASLSQASVDDYLDLSGDRNPIHADFAAARAAGLTAPVVPGLLLVSLVQPLCNEVYSGAALRELKARFLAPVPVGAKLRLHLQHRGVDPQSRAERLRVFLSAAPNAASAIVDMTLVPRAT